MMMLRNRQQGFSLIELMISMSISLLLIAMILSVFINSANNHTMRNSLASLQENSRFAAHFFSRDFRSLGFWGCLEGGESNVNVLSSDAAIADTVSKQLKDAQDNGFLGSLAATDGASDKIEILTLLEQSYPLGIDLASVTSPINVAGTSLAAGDEFLIGDCHRADLIKVSAKNGDNFEHKDTHNSSNDLSHAYNRDALIYPIVKISYQLATGDNGNSALFRKVNNEAGNGTELISDVENMQILYGLADVDGNILGYTPASAIAASDLGNVISVRISLLLSSAQEVLSTSTAYNYNGVNDVMPADKKMRKVYTATYTLRNRIKG